jgi:hypothetical protein
VIAVEPSSRERVNLQRNVEANRLTNVTVVPLALGAAAGTANLRLAKGTHSGHNTLGNFAHAGVQMDSFEEVKVDALDAVATRLGLSRVDFIKVDVEGPRPVSSTVPRTSFCRDAADAPAGDQRDGPPGATARCQRACSGRCARSSTTRS